MRTKLLAALLVPGALWGTGCLVASDDILEGKACSREHPCAEGYICVPDANVCHKPGFDAGPDTDAGSGTDGGSDGGHDGGPAGFNPDQNNLIGSLAFDPQGGAAKLLGASTSTPRLVTALARVPLACNHGQIDDVLIIGVQLHADFRGTIVDGPFTFTSYMDGGSQTGGAYDAAVSFGTLFSADGIILTSPRASGVIDVDSVANGEASGTFTATVGLMDGGSGSVSGEFQVPICP